MSRVAPLLFLLACACGGAPAPPPRHAPDEVSEPWTADDDAPLEGEESAPKKTRRGAYTR